MNCATSCERQAPALGEYLMTDSTSVSDLYVIFEKGQGFKLPACCRVNNYSGVLPTDAICFRLILAVASVNKAGLLTALFCTLTIGTSSCLVCQSSFEVGFCLELKIGRAHV